MRSGSKASETRMVMKIIKTPVRVLCKARDAYVRGMNQYATRTTYGTALPRSFSTTSYGSNDCQENLRELIRSNTTTKMEYSSTSSTPIQQQRRQAQPEQFIRKVPRSCSVAMGRIDEERVYSFREDNFGTNYNQAIHERSMYSRSGSFAKRRL